MATKKYDEFCKLTADKMAQTISDVTYLYKDTEVPKTHYKKWLEEIVEIEMDQLIEHSILDTYVKTLKRIIDDSPSLFFKALICIDKKISPTNMRPKEYIALSSTYDYYSLNEKMFKGIVDDRISTHYDEVLKNGNTTIYKETLN